MRSIHKERINFNNCSKIEPILLKIKHSKLFMGDKTKKEGCFEKKNSLGENNLCQEKTGRFFQGIEVKQEEIKHLTTNQTNKQRIFRLVGPFTKYVRGLQSSGRRPSAAWRWRARRPNTNRALRVKVKTQPLHPIINSGISSVGPSAS